MIKIYNTLSRSKEEFKPIKEGEVSFYQCGPTVYWVQHLGNMRAAMMGDIIRRTFIYNGFKVKYCTNYTDVGHLTGDNVGDADTGEDRMEKAVKREGGSPDEIAQKYIDLYEKHKKALNVLEPDFKPRATEVIPEIIDMVKTLLEKGFAYKTDLAVYFDVLKFPNYNQLNRQKIEENEAGAGTGEVSDPQKKNAVDFALWFFRAGAHKNAIQYWPSPFHSKLVENGDGFPGWHIECSAMVKKFLGLTIDIHMGGIEHVSIHHTNEIAQSESANGVKYVDYWMHNEHMLVDNGRMSKSQGTGYSLDEVIEKGYEPMDVRYLMLQTHYRSKQNFTWEGLDAARNGLESIKNKIKLLGTEKGSVSEKFVEEFRDKLNDDFNTPQALAVLQEVLKSDISNADKLATVLDLDKVLGLKLDEVKSETIEIPEEIIKLAEDRKTAKLEKNFELADSLRAKINEAGYEVEDLPEGNYKIIKK